MIILIMSFPLPSISIITVIVIEYYKLLLINLWRVPQVWVKQFSTVLCKSSIFSFSYTRVSFLIDHLYLKDSLILFRLHTRTIKCASLIAILANARGSVHIYMFNFRI